ncbi:hypothetical protein [Listeria sp. ILCC797]|uniref:hypothetical protein n=1 Tax=Listeria sp. ILCC797 TaxID=1918333 RepID=UPI000B58D40D|nr:hypothetical protein [Listeria sp. ILCC797]
MPFISYDSEDLIDELREDIKEFGKELEVWCFFKFIENRKIYTNYDFVGESEIQADELADEEHLDRLPAWKLLERLEQQNSIL